MINEIDRRILDIIQSNARTPNAEIARKVGLAPSAVFERVRKLEERGILRGYHADIDPKAVDLGQLAFMFIRANDRPGAVGTAAQLSKIPEILELHHVAGEDCFLAKVRVRDAESLGRLLRERLSRIETITSTRTTMVLETVKATVELPLEAADGQDEEAASA